MRVQVYRVQVGEVTETTAIPHGRVETQDANAYKGDEKVTVPGVDGKQTTTYRVTVTDGVEMARQQLSTAVVTPPVDEQVTVGTKQRPAAPASTSGLNWDALAKC